MKIWRLIRIGSVLVLLTAAIASTQAATHGVPGSCRVAQQDFIGNWDDRASAGVLSEDSQQVQFAIEGGRRIYRSWLHQRPDMNGTWVFSGCQVKVSGPDNLQMAYRFVGSDKRRLTEVDSGSTYRRIR